jgi:hypothetical protein
VTGFSAEGLVVGLPINRVECQGEPVKFLSDVGYKRLIMNGCSYSSVEFSSDRRVIIQKADPIIRGGGLVVSSGSDKKDHGGHGGKWQDHLSYHLGHVRTCGAAQYSVP